MHVDLVAFVSSDHGMSIINHQSSIINHQSSSLLHWLHQSSIIHCVDRPGQTMSKFEKVSLRSTPAFDYDQHLTSRGTSPHRGASSGHTSTTPGSPSSLPSHHHGHPRQARSLSPFSGGAHKKPSKAGKNNVIVCHASAHAVVRTGTSTSTSTSIRTCSFLLFCCFILGVHVLYSKRPIFNLYEFRDRLTDCFCLLFI
jgi:hypothetical protein